MVLKDSLATRMRPSERYFSVRGQVVFASSILIAFLLTFSFMYFDVAGSLSFDQTLMGKSSCPNYSHIKSPETKPDAVEFKEHEEYKSLNPEFDSLWDEVLTPNGGFLYMIEDDKPRKYGISMFHQLHCLQILRTKMQKMQRQIDGEVDDSSTLHEHHEHAARAEMPTHAKHEEHAMHCFDYLRQVNNKIT